MAARPKRQDPVKFSQKMADEICRRMADDGELLRQICRSPGMPALSTVNRWLRSNEAFRTQYARARTELIEGFAEESIEIVDNGSNDWMEREARNGGIVRVPNQELVARSKLRAEQRRWMMAHALPQKYGDKLNLNIGGQEGAPPIRSIAAVTTDPVEAAKLYQEAVRGIVRPDKKD